MNTVIKFGTSGWRAIVAEEFTVSNVRRAVNGKRWDHRRAALL